ncbi:MAG TPA: L-threonylcarbamoyladenylate synthase [Microlunatus sp.]|nr:L-threonylcarbamoyladenylate synthase [Microlunatus sp.]
MNEVRRDEAPGLTADQPQHPVAEDPAAPATPDDISDTEAWIKAQLAGPASQAAAATDPEQATRPEPTASTEAGEAEPAEVAESSADTSAAESDRTGDAASADAGPVDVGDAGTADGDGAGEEQVEEPTEPTYQRFDLTSGDPGVLAEAAESARLAIENGDCIVLPTDTVYGIGADAFNGEAVQRLQDAKERGRDKPPPVLIGDPALIRALADEVPETATRLSEKHWPGALTVIVKARESVRIDLGETRGTIGLRVPDHDLTRELLRQTGPMAVTSANLTGRPAALTCDEAIEYFGNKVAVYLDAGPLEYTGGAPSSLVDFSQDENGQLLRVGALSLDLLRETCPDLQDLTEPEQPEPDPADTAESTAEPEGPAGELTGAAGSESPQAGSDPDDLSAEPDQDDIERLIEDRAETAPGAEPPAAEVESPRDGTPDQT